MLMHNFKQTRVRKLILSAGFVLTVLTAYAGIYGNDELEKTPTWLIIIAFLQAGFFNYFLTSFSQANTNSLETLFCLIEKQNEFEQIFNNLDESVITFENGEQKQLNENFRQLIQNPGSFGESTQNRASISEAKLLNSQQFPKIQQDVEI
jgi:hypothetical protein